MELAGGVLPAVLLTAGLVGSDAHRDWSVVQITVVVLAGLDPVGGILTNATNAAKRWYHRQAPGIRRARLLFVSAHLAHLAHLATMGLVVLDGDWGRVLTNSALLLTAAVTIECTPVHLTRPVAMAAYTAAVLMNLFWLTVPAVLAWFAPLFFLKLLVCHLTPEAPLVMKTDD